jgi:Fe-S oxidoreductase
VLARIGGLVRFGAQLPITANLLLGSRPARWALEKVFGLSRRRMLPKLALRPFLSRARRAGLTTRGGPAPTDGPTSVLRVAYFVDVFANHADPLIGEATVAVLRHHGIEVYVPPRQKGCGVAALTQGDLDSARELAAHNVRVFADLIRDGHVIVASEPTAVVTISQDYPLLADDADTKLVASQTQDLTAFLWGMYEVGWLRTDFQKPLDLTLGHHVPCHVKALGGEPAGPKLLRLIPGVRVKTIDKSCSGMAGTYGLKASAYEASLRAGRPMLDELNDPAVRYGSTECSTCRMQMQEGSRKRTLHPVQYLAYAYGLLPKLEKKLRRPLGKLVTD